MSCGLNLRDPRNADSTLVGAGVKGQQKDERSGILFIEISRYDRVFCCTACRLKSIDWLKYADQGLVLHQLKKWDKMLRRICIVLDDAELQTTNQLVDIWLTDLRHLAYDLEDLLDELATEIQQRNLEEENDKVRPNKVRRIISSFSAAVDPRTVKFNMEMISKIDMITVRLDEIIKEKDDLNLIESNRNRACQESERPPSTSLVNEAKVYGREKDKKAILELLEAADSGVDVPVIPIIGMGGVGKTTLAQLTYNDISLQFDFKVSVGEDFDVFRITKTILQSVDSHDIDRDLDSLQVKLKQELSGKKCLVVLDDVWSENYEHWTLFRGPFEAGARGSRIIITTRSQEVSRVLAGTVTAYHLKELMYNECMSVFCQHALGVANFDQHLDVKAIGQKIVERCKGLPLAAKALGGLLRGKPNINAWEEVLKSEIWDLPYNKSNILPALRLSYLYLPPHLKRCFAYCSIFPKVYKFDRKDLVLLWMAEGFLYPQTKEKKKEDLGHQYFDDLLSKSFFQQSNHNKSKYVMHDLINDLAHFVSKETCFHLVDNGLDSLKSYADIRHSSFICCDYDNSQGFECFNKMTKLRTFLSLRLFDYWGKNLDRKVLHDILPKLKCLRVLSPRSYDITELPSSVVELKQLRYLDLSYTLINRLPESMGNLVNLETLKLHACRKLVELPKCICSLTNLLHLHISATSSLKKMPPGIGNLTSLRTLSKFIVGEGNNGLKLSELNKLSQSAEQLEIEVYRMSEMLDMET